MHLKGETLKIKYSKNLEHLKFLKSYCRKTSKFHCDMLSFRQGKHLSDILFIYLNICVFSSSVPLVTSSSENIHGQDNL